MITQGRARWRFAALILSANALAACHSAARTAGADPSQGAEAMTREACGACHRIPGVGEANGDVGPSLAHFARQRLIAGHLPNTQANLEHYLKAPQTIVPGNAMPNQRLSDAEARDIAAYLMTLR